MFSHAIAKTRLLDYLVNGFTNRLKNWYGAMPHVTEHTSKISTRSVKPYACESSREKRQQDRQTARQTDTQTDCAKPLFSTFWGLYTSQIRSYLEVDFLHDANTSIDMEVKIISYTEPVKSYPKSTIVYEVLHSYTNFKLRIRKFTHGF